NSIANEVVIASATGAETSASLANGWIETDAQGVNLFTATMALNGAYWPSSGEDLYELVIPNTTGGGNETGTTAQLTAGVNYMTGLPVPYSNITAQRQGWDLFVPGPGDIVAFYGAFETFEDHGTWVSTDLAGVPFGNAGGIFDIYGTAPGAKIIGVDLPTSFDT